MTKLTAETITTDQIRRLRTEALTAGDSMQAELCELALDLEQTEARAECARVINEAHAMEDE